MNIWAILENVRKNYLSKENFYSLLTDRKTTGKEYENVVKVWKKIEMKTIKYYHDLYLKCDVLLLAYEEESRKTRIKTCCIIRRK